MFDHLDDPNPPQPSALLVDRIAAEGAHRLRRRRIVAGGAIVAAATLAVAGIAAAGRLPGQDGSDVDTIGPVGPDTTTTTSEAPSTSTTPESTTTTTTTAGQPGNSTPTPPDTGEGRDTFAAVIKHPSADTAQVVLASATTGEVDRVLAEFPLLNRPMSCCVAWSPQEQAVYYVVPAGDYGSGMLPDTIWRVAVDDTTPDQMVAGSNPSLSPDGTKLAYTTPYEGDTPGALVVHDLDGGGERRFVAPSVEHGIYATGFADDDTVVFASADPEAPPRVAALSLLGSGDQLSEAEALGPPSTAPPGTGWSSPELRVADGLLGVVETCCDLDANSHEGGASYLVVDPASGAELDRVALPGRMLDAEAGPEGTEQLFLRPPPDSPGPNSLLRRAGGELVEIGANTQFIAIDW